MTGELDPIIEAIEKAVVDIDSGIHERRRFTGTTNPSDDAQLTADVWADDLLLERLTTVESVGAVASEERADIADSGDGFSVTVDPIDGSKNIISNNTAGTIIGVYDAELPAKGRELVAAAYSLYGPTTTLTVARDGEVFERTLDNDGQTVGKERVKLPTKPEVFGFGGTTHEWFADFDTFATEVKRDLDARYGGAFVGDVNQVLQFGGIYAYPANQSRPRGKLRHQFECNPLAYVVESAGGRSSDGNGSVLDRPANDLHGRTPVYLGNPELVKRAESQLQ